MQFILTFVITLIGGLFLYALINSIVTTPGAMLQKRFVSINPLRGKTKQTIISAVGPPNGISAIGQGTLLQWQATGYHIALQFDLNDMCVGVTHEFRV